MEDERIVELYWARSESAIRETETKYGSYCGRIARNILGNAEDAQECLNDTWLAAWNAIPPHRPSVLKPFLGAITRRIALTKQRDSLRLKRGGGEAALALEELEDCVPSDESVEEQFEAKELEAAISRFVGSLPDTERRVFILRYWYVEPIDTICLKSGFGRSKVKSMLLRTRKRLGEYLKKEGF